ncbi:endonuclease/exonuclease/phosphatase family protein [Actinoplanes derwentensis]|nr:endonuclease/exonuclease/phosphatase family protein [Actinoplanes derwentensis]
MRLLTFNALFKGDVRERLRALGERLERSDYDVVCLQEVMYRRNVRLLETVAPSYRYRACSGSVVLRGGLVVLSRLPITGSEFRRFPLTAPARPEYLMRKGAQIVTIDRVFTVVNTHLSANRDDDWSPGNRYSAAQRTEFAVLAERIAGIGTPVVVVGDLNVPRESAGLAGLLAATGLRDVLAGDTRPTYRPTPGWPSPPAFDHVLVRPAAVQCRADLVFQDEVRLPGGGTSYLSDHYGVEAELTYPDCNHTAFSRKL